MKNGVTGCQDMLIVSINDHTVEASDIAGKHVLSVRKTYLHDMKPNLTSLNGRPQGELLYFIFHHVHKMWGACLNNITLVTRTYLTLCLGTSLDIQL